MRTSLRVNPHIWKILKNFEALWAISSCFVTSIQLIRVLLQKKPECLKSYGVIFKDGDDLIGFKNDSY
ncbi:MAG: hypothetical protein K1060chlam1_01019 [Candidatus Anoxychlamydiales bacterium]|nr:hypothetical protein [Candidatus Anoxychlamydiales bacterium]